MPFDEIERNEEQGLWARWAHLAARGLSMEHELIFSKLML
jgi:uridine phosphorylase